ncbi:hypothetical protein ACTXJY_00365 [Corynebacterium casei]|uniref:hypothetical protein n=1 Tax=Corynebacterium casei TaxID=160386 RepID=UPI003FD1E5BF
MTERNTVDKEIYLALAKHNLAAYTDTLMDTLDDFVDWDHGEEDVTWADTDIYRDRKKDDA